MGTLKKSVDFWQLPCSNVHFTKCKNVCLLNVETINPNRHVLEGEQKMFARGDSLRGDLWSRHLVLSKNVKLHLIIQRYLVYYSLRCATVRQKLIFQLLEVMNHRRDVCPALPKFVKLLQFTPTWYFESVTKNLFVPHMFWIAVELGKHIRKESKYGRVWKFVFWKFSSRDRGTRKDLVCLVAFTLQIQENLRAFRLWLLRL